MNRRSFLLAAAALSMPAIPAAAGVETTSPLRACVLPSFAIPRGVVVEMHHMNPPAEHYRDISGCVSWATGVPMISTGKELIVLESEEGQRIQREFNPIPVNLNADGSMQGRRYHRTKRIPDDWCCKGQ